MSVNGFLMAGMDLVGQRFPCYTTLWQKLREGNFGIGYRITLEARGRRANDFMFKLVECDM